MMARAVVSTVHPDVQALMAEVEVGFGFEALDRSTHCAA